MPGEYEKTYKRIEELNKRRAEIKSEIERLQIRLYELDVEVGECYGYLKELDWIDNH